MSNADYGPPLLQYGRMLWRRKGLVSLIVLGLTLPAAALSASQPPVYSATAEVVLGQQRLDDDFNIQATDLSDRQIATQMRVVTSNAVTDLAEEQGAVGTVEVSTPSLSNVLVLTAQGPTPAAAASTANAYAEAYLEHRTRQARATLDDAVGQLEQRIALLQQEIDPLDEQVRQASPDQRDAALAAVRPLLSRLQEQRANLQAQLGQLQVQLAIAGSGANIVHRAEPPTAPISPKPIRDGALAAVLGVAVAVSLVVLLETLRKGRGDVHGLPVVPLSGAYATTPRLRRRLSAWLTPDAPESRRGAHYGAPRDSLALAPEEVPR